MKLPRLLRNWLIIRPGDPHPLQSELVAYVTGDLEPRRRGEVFVHSSECSFCARELRQISDTFSHFESISGRAVSAAAGSGSVSEDRERLLAAMQALGASAGCGLIRQEVEVFLGATGNNLVDRSPCGAGAELKVAAVQRPLETFLGRRAAQALRGQLLQLAEGV